VSHKSVLTAKCDDCGGRFALYRHQRRLWYHKHADYSGRCPGSLTAHFSDIRKENAHSRLYRKEVAPPVLKVAPSLLRTRCAREGEIVSAKAFRQMPYENWLNRWERKFGVKIPDENVKRLTNGRFIRREEK